MKKPARLRPTFRKPLTTWEEWPITSNVQRPDESESRQQPVLGLFLVTQVLLQIFNKMLSFKRIDGTARVNLYVKELNNQRFDSKIYRVDRSIALICLPARSNWL